MDSDSSPEWNVISLLAVAAQGPPLRFDHGTFSQLVGFRLVTHVSFLVKPAVYLRPAITCYFLFCALFAYILYYGRLWPVITFSFLCIN